MYVKSTRPSAKREVQKERSAKRDVHKFRSAQRDDRPLRRAKRGDQIVRRRRAHICELRAMRMCPGSGQIFLKFVYMVIVWRFNLRKEWKSTDWLSFMKKFFLSAVHRKLALSVSFCVRKVDFPTHFQLFARKTTNICKKLTRYTANKKHLSYFRTWYEIYYYKHIFS